MKIKAQISMVMNLDKCIGCHTCSVTCKNTWTNRKGTEYMYWNNVETRPGLGYPKGWEDQDVWKGGWELSGGKLRLKSGPAWKRLLKMFYNPEQPGMDDYFEPWTYDYEKLISSGRVDQQPVALPHSLVTGERMQVTWGPNWDDDLAGTKYARQDYDLVQVNGKRAACAGAAPDASAADSAPAEADETGRQIKMEMEDLFMRYLPRTCNHCLNPACVAACPSGAIYKRDEDGVVLINQDTCRGWRACVPACPYKKVFYNWETNKSEKCIFCYPRLESGLPTVCAETCVGRLRYMGVLLYDAERVEAAAMTEDPQQIWRAICDVIVDPNDPAVVAQAKADGISDSWIAAAQSSPVYKLIREWNLALPLHAEYRTLPMVWYIPPMSPVLKHLSDRADLARASEMRIPVDYLAELFSAGDPEPVRRVIDTLVAVRRHMRAKDAGAPEPACSIAPEVLDQMYRLLAIAKYDERFNVPAKANPEGSASLCEQRGTGIACAGCMEGFRS